MSSFNIGPFHLYRSENGTLDISLKCMADWACGWEYGWEEYRGSVSKPVLSIRIGKLMILYFEAYHHGLELWLLGFWCMPSWGSNDQNRRG